MTQTVPRCRHDIMLGSRQEKTRASWFVFKAERRRTIIELLRLWLAQTDPKRTGAATHVCPSVALQRISLPQQRHPFQAHSLSPQPDYIRLKQIFTNYNPHQSPLYLSTYDQECQIFKLTQTTTPLLLSL